MALVRHFSTVASLARHAGPREAARQVAEQLYGTRAYLALRCDLERLPSRRPAAIPLHMTPRDCRTSAVFEDEASRARGTDYLEVMLRRGWCQAGIEQPFVADGPDGRPAYCQWLLRERDQWRMQEYSPGRYPVLRPEEVMLEGGLHVYRVPAQRGNGRRHVAAADARACRRCAGGHHLRRAGQRRIVARLCRSRLHHPPRATQHPWIHLASQRPATSRWHHTAAVDRRQTPNHLAIDSARSRPPISSGSRESSPTTSNSVGRSQSNGSASRDAQAWEP
jgi:hypothetical protein